jgi:hypothetical protein
MNLTTPTASNSQMTVTLMLEPLASGAIAASAIEFPDCRVEAVTREEAIAQLHLILTARLSQVELLASRLPVHVEPPKPAWLKFAGIFQDDPDFAEIMEQLRAERESDDDSEVDPAYYLGV